jgi:magnesium transporter
VLDPVDSDFAVLQERFRLHTLAVEDSMSPAQVPKVDLYDGQIFVVLATNSALLSAGYFGCAPPMILIS